MTLLATIISRTQAQLLDDGTLFTTATVTSAVRQALRDFNQRAPMNGAEIVAVVAAQKSYKLTGGTFPTLILDILDVLKNDDTNEDDEPLDFDKNFENNDLYIRLRTAESSGNLLIRYTYSHTVNGLDDETESTMNTEQDQILVDGACAYACRTRATGIIENNNLTQESVDGYERAAKRFMLTFNYGLERFASRPMPASEKRTTSWLADTDSAI